MLALSTGLGVSRARRSAITATPLRIAEVQGRLACAAASSAGKNAQVFRWPYITGCELKDIVLNLSNWYLGISAETNTGNAITIVEMAVEAPNGTVVPVYFSGIRSKVLANGDSDIKSDPLTAAAFGYTTIARNAQFWIKGIVTVPVAGNAIPNNDYQNAGDVSNAQVGWYDTAATTPSSTDVAGVYTATGTAFTTAAYGFRPIMLGHPVSDGVSFIAVGDSIGQGYYDSSANGVGGRGFIQRAVYNYGRNPLPCLNLCRASARISLMTGGSKWLAYIPYARHAIDEYATNDVDDGASAATIQGRLTTLWSQLRTGGISRIYRTELMCKTSSTDTWATVANQTAASGWGVGEVAAQMNSWFQTKVGDQTIHALVSMSAIKDPGTPTKWKCSDIAAAQYSSNDGLHPSANGHILAAWPLRLALTEDETKTYNSVSGLSLWLDAADMATILDANGVNAASGGFLGKVATWVDKSESGQNATQTTDSKRPSFSSRTMNGRVVADFDGSDDTMVVGSAAINYGATTVIEVYLPDTATTSLSLLANAGSGASSTRFFSNNQACDFGNTLLARTSPQSGSPIIQVARIDKTGAGARQRLNINSDTPLTGTVTRATPNSTYAVASYGSGSASFFDGGLALKLVYKKSLTPEEINTVAGLIAQTWGTTLAAVVV